MFNHNDDGEESFADMIAKGEVILGDKYGKDGGGNHNKKQARQNPNPNPRPQYDGGAKYLTNGFDERRLREVRKDDPEDSIDLHGMVKDDAIDALDEFIVDAQSRGLRHIEVIHGKGAGILKPSARQWLAQCAAVLAFTEVNGNGGAVRVVLRG